MDRVKKMSNALFFSSIVSFLIIANAVSASAQEKFICVWRNPERTMTRLFPEARDYKTKTVDITPEKLAKIEKRIGMEVLAGQRKQFQYYEMVDGEGGVIGYTSAVTQKGEFGAIEFVFGLSRDYKIVGIYIQRSRERLRDFKEPSFLDTFVGKSVADGKKISDPLADKGNIGSRAVVNGVRKELVSFDELVLK